MSTGPEQHESGIPRTRLPASLRQAIMDALQRGDDTYDDILDAIEDHWPTPAPKLRDELDSIEQDPMAAQRRGL